MGCPTSSVEDAIEWKKQRITDSTLVAKRPGKGRAFHLATRLREAESDGQTIIKFDELSRDYAEIVNMIVTLYKDEGWQPPKISAFLKLTIEVVLRVVHQHPETKSITEAHQRSSLARCLQLASGHLEAVLSDPERSATLKPSELNFLVGTLHDKLAAAPPTTEISLTLKTVIESASIADLMQSIPRDIKTANANIITPTTIENQPNPSQSANPTTNTDK